MNHEQKQRLLVGLISMLFLSGIMGTRPLIPLFSSELHANSIQIGIIIALYSLLPFIIAVKMGRIIDNIGCKKPMVISVTFGCFSLLIPFLLPNLIGIYVSQVISGLAQLVFIVAVQTLVGKSENSMVREKNVLFFSLGVAIGSFLGPLIGGFFSDSLGYEHSFLILSGISLTALLFIFLLKENPIKDGVQKSSTHTKTFELFESKNLRKAFLISILVLLGKDIYIAYFPLLLKDNGSSDTIIGVIIAIHSGAGIVSRWGLPKLLEYMNRNQIIIISIIISGGVYLLFPFDNGYLLSSILSFLLGIALGIAQPLSVSTTILFLPKYRVGEGLGLRLSLNRFTQMSTPFLLGITAQFFGIASIFWIVGSCLLVGTTKISFHEKKKFKR